MKWYKLEKTTPPINAICLTLTKSNEYHVAQYGNFSWYVLGSYFEDDLKRIQQQTITHFCIIQPPDCLG